MKNREINREAVVFAAYELYRIILKAATEKKKKVVTVDEVFIAMDHYQRIRAEMGYAEMGYNRAEEERDE